jgi:sortase A
MGTVRRVVRGLGWTSVWLGALTLGFVVHQLWITTWLSQLNQGDLEIERLEHFAAAVITEVELAAPPATTVPPTVDPSSPPAPASPPVKIRHESAPERHSAFALIRVPRLERLQEGWNVVEGVSVQDLRNGAGHMPNTPLPGQPGNAVISGHRTTYGAPFHEFDELEPGDAIEVETALGVHVYEVRESIVVEPTDVWVTAPRDGAWLTLTTCNPKFSARERLVVFAELVDGPNAEAIEALT